MQCGWALERQSQRGRPLWVHGLWVPVCPSVCVWESVCGWCLCVSVACFWLCVLVVCVFVCVGDASWGWAAFVGLIGPQIQHYLRHCNQWRLFKFHWNRIKILLTAPHTHTVHPYTHIHTLTHTHTNRQTDRHVDLQTHPNPFSRLYLTKQFSTICKGMLMYESIVVSSKDLLSHFSAKFLKNFRKPKHNYDYRLSKCFLWKR